MSSNIKEIEDTISVLKYFADNTIDPKQLTDAEKRRLFHATSYGYRCGANNINKGMTFGQFVKESTTRVALAAMQ